MVVVVGFCLCEFWSMWIFMAWIIFFFFRLFFIPITDSVYSLLCSLKFRQFYRQNCNFDICLIFFLVKILYVLFINDFFVCLFACYFSIVTVQCFQIHTSGANHQEKKIIVLLIGNFVVVVIVQCMRVSVCKYTKINKKYIPQKKREEIYCDCATETPNRLSVNLVHKVRKSVEQFAKKKLCSLNNICNHLHILVTFRETNNFRFCFVLFWFPFIICKSIVCSNFFKFCTVTYVNTYKINQSNNNKQNNENKPEREFIVRVSV